MDEDGTPMTGITSEDGTSRVDAGPGNPGHVDLGAVAASLAHTGFLLEHRVHHVLRTSGYTARLGALYKDAESDAPREMDVVVSDHSSLEEAGLTIWTSIVAECKAWANPVVVIGRSRSDIQPFRTFTEAAFRGGPLATPTPSTAQYGGLCGYLQLRRLPSSVESVDFLGTQMVLLERAGSRYKAKNDGIYTSVLRPLVKAAQYERKRLGGRERDDDRPTTELVLSFPILVTSGPVLEAVPATSAEIASGVPHVVVREVGWTRILRSFDEEQLPSSAIVEVVTESALPLWIQERAQGFKSEVIRRVESALPVFEAHLLGAQIDERKLAMTASAWRSF